MKVILKEDIKGLGKKGEVKEVKDGYAANFLIPHNKAVPATEGNVKVTEMQRKKMEEEKKKMKENAQKIADQINGKKIEIIAKGENDKLFGSLKEKEIKQALQEQGINIENGSLEFDKIKSAGEHPVKIVWRGTGIEANFKVSVLIK